MDKFSVYFSKRRFFWAIGILTAILGVYLILLFLFVSGFIEGDGLSFVERTTEESIDAALVFSGLTLHILLVVLPSLFCPETYCLSGDHIPFPTVVGLIYLVIFWGLVLAAVSFRYPLLLRKNQNDSKAK
jgi:hypothetical protein